MPRNPIIPYRRDLKTKARELRNNPTYAEKILWQGLRRKQLGIEFHRQVPLDRFIVDFYCHELKLAIEVDGISHDNPAVKVHDDKRQLILEKLGIRFLRFADAKILSNVELVIDEIQQWINKNKR